jgi:hypothetical protein
MCYALPTFLLLFTATYVNVLKYQKQLGCSEARTAYSSSLKGLAGRGFGGVLRLMLEGKPPSSSLFSSRRNFGEVKTNSTLLASRNFLAYSTRP